jgi:cobalamin biosynthesis Mg chelatase CobN
LSEDGNTEMSVSEGSRSALEATGESITAGTGPAVAQQPADTKSHPAAEETAHRPSEHSPWPILVAVGLLLVAVGILHQWLIAGLGGIVLLVAVVGWLWQPWAS